MATEQELLQRIEKLENELTQLKQDMSHINRKYIDKHRFIIEQGFQNYVNDISIWLVAHFILQNPNQQTFFIEMLESEDLDSRGESFVQDTFEYLIDF